MACLVWDSPEGRKVFALDRAVLVVGRDAASDVALADATVSRRHALLQVDGDRVRITDLGSTSKTRINGAALVRDVASTLEAGDVIHFGKLGLTFHLAPPDARAQAKSPTAARRQRGRARAAAAKPKAKTAEPEAKEPEAKAPRAARKERAPAPKGGTGPWKLVAIVLAFVVVALLGAMLALHGSEREQPVVLAEPPAPDAGGTGNAPPAQPEPARPAEATEPAKTEPAKTEPAEPEVERAPAGALPPAGAAPVDACPDLLETDDGAFFVVAVHSFDESNVEVRGRDGKVYALPRRRVARVLDRADLVRRVAVQRAGLAPDEVASRMTLARWCVARYVGSEALQLLAEVEKLAPGNEEARALKREAEGMR